MGAGSRASGAGHFSPNKDETEDEVAIDQVQRRSRRKVSHQLKNNESSDLEQVAAQRNL